MAAGVGSLSRRTTGIGLAPTPQTPALAPYTPKPSAPAMPTSMPAMAPAQASGGAAPVGGEGGAKIVDPGTIAPPSMQALAGGSGGGYDAGGSAEATGGPSQFRQGIGKRIFPQDSAALAALRQVY